MTSGGPVTLTTCLAIAERTDEEIAAEEIRVSVRLLSPDTRDCVEPAQRLRVMASPASRNASMIRQPMVSE
jgi:hypothetical protein